MINAEMLMLIGMGIVAMAMYMMHRYFDDRIECNSRKNIEHCNKFCEDLHKRMERLEYKLKDELKNKSNCCKSGREQSNAESWRFDSRIRRLEENCFTKESQTETGERVISVIVPNLEDVPSVIDPLGYETKRGSDVDNDSDENFYVKSDVEKKLSEKYPDFDEITSVANIELLNKNNSPKARWLSKIVDLHKKGEETYLAIKKMNSKDKE